jgi:short-subunit dehydrogenase
MKQFKDKVAVITGAASDIGKAIAKRCVIEGMKVVLAHIEKEALLQTEDEMKADGGIALSFQADVSKKDDIQNLAKETLLALGCVHLLCNNTGAPYLVSKHAVVALSEKLYYDLGENIRRMKISVICPGGVKTRILESGRNRPPEYQDETAEIVITPEMVAVMQQYQQAVETGML